MSESAKVDGPVDPKNVMTKDEEKVVENIVEHEIENIMEEKIDNEIEDAVADQTRWLRLEMDVAGLCTVFITIVTVISTIRLKKQHTENMYAQTKALNAQVNLKLFQDRMLFYNNFQKFVDDLSERLKPYIAKKDSNLAEWNLEFSNILAKVEQMAITASFLFNIEDILGDIKLEMEKLQKLTLNFNKSKASLSKQDYMEEFKMTLNNITSKLRNDVNEKIAQVTKPVTV